MSIYYLVHAKTVQQKNEPQRKKKQFIGQNLIRVTEKQRSAQILGS